MERFGPLMQRLRKERGLTLEAVARKIGSHKGYVSGFENGKVNPPAWRLIHKLSRIFNYDETALQVLAWAEKAPRVCRDEVRRLLEVPAKSGCACVVTDGRIGALCGLHFALKGEVREEAARRCERVAEAVKDPVAAGVARECARIIRENRDPGKPVAGEGNPG